MSDSHDLVCVYNSSSETKAALVRNFLVQEGIRATVSDTHNPFPGLTITPSEVFVERADEERARSLIAEAEHLHHEEADEEGDDDEEEENADS